MTPLALLFALAAQQSAALDYVVPSGWTRTPDPQSGLVSLAPPGLRGGRLCVITVFQPEVFASSAAQFHDEIVRRAASSAARILEVPQQSSVGAFLVTTMHEVMPNGLQLWVRIYTGRWSDRGQVFILTANVPDLARQYTPVADSMMSHIALPQVAAAPPAPAASAPSVPPPAPAAPAGSGGLSGLYMTLKNKGGLTYGVSKDYMVFFPNGRVYWHLPEEGLLGFDVARSQREDASFWGSYELHGDDIHIRWGTGLEYDGRRLADGKLAIAGYAYVPQSSGPDGRSLSGTYRPQNTGADPSHDVRFYPDGRFDDRSVRFVVGAIDLMYGRAKVPPQGGLGRYRIAQHSIVFEYADGRREQLSFYVPDDGGSPTPRLLVINTFSVVRVDR